MRNAMTGQELQRMRLQFFAIGGVGIIAVGIYAALDAGNDLFSVLWGLIQFLAMGAIGVGVYLNRHRLMNLLQPKASLPVDTPQTVSTPAPIVPESRMVLVAPNRHQLLTFDETAQALQSAVHELALTQSLQSQYEKVVGELDKARAQLRTHDQAAQQAVDAAVEVAMLQWAQDRANIEERHAAALLQAHKERDEALATNVALQAASSRAGLPELLQVITAATQGKLTRDLAKTVATFSNKDYGPFAQSVRTIFASPSPVLKPLIMPVVPGGITGEISISGDQLLGEGDTNRGRTDIYTADGPTDQPCNFSDRPSDGVTTGYAIVLYNADFAQVARRAA